MTESTNGICLHYYKYSESSVIVKIFTEKYGMKSYIMKGVRKRKSKKKLNLLHSLNIVELEVSNNDKRQIQYIKDINNTNVFNYNSLDINNRFISLFISEVLLRVLVESERSQSVYNFIMKSIFLLNNEKKVSKNFSIVFLIKLSGLLGFYPNKENSEKKYFNLDSGEFSNNPSNYFLGDDNKKYFSLLLNDHEVEIPHKNRKNLIFSLQNYYDLHHYNIKNLKSYDVIESLRK